MASMSEYYVIGFILKKKYLKIARYLIIWMILFSYKQSDLPIRAA